jgi:hypothetical protein
MLIHFYISVFLLTSTIVSNVNPQGALRQYVVHRDFLRGLKASEYSVYDKTEKHVYYRIESNYGLPSNIEIIAYPSKQVVGRLQPKLKLFGYNAEFSILDPKSNQWIKGSIHQKFQLFVSPFNIEWNGHHITMENERDLFTAKFSDANGELLAEYGIRRLSIFLTNTYDMKIFSSKYPDLIYLLALAVRDNRIGQGKSG